MITSWFYSNSTLNTKQNCMHKNRGNSACKHAEFVNVWYDYARYVYGPKQHIYIIDNASPIQFKDIFDSSKEKVEFLEKDQYSYDKDIFIHVKRFDEHLNHGGGVVRATHEGFKFNVLNNLNYSINEGDSLSLNNLIQELEGFDLITTNIQDGQDGRGNVDSSNWAMRKELLTDYPTQVPNAYGYQKLSVFDSLDQSIKANGICTTQPNYQYYASVEDGPYINFRKTHNFKKLNGPVVHDVNERTLKEFVENHNDKVQSKYALEYISKL